ncbi:alpha/beta-hydrolase [Coniochaeta ligniaria NRRL 30616]|uniref:Alpha/beta-hydrolase n=1 Tax=Coniochaeta ligniaria NRRL 30616 TaxID=1408157 RepID=A0A1J7IYT2_9PEZI|nr:alpha/beta-hydrolase [Coniochaeta ligniaria NRRL 30616]
MTRNLLPLAVLGASLQHVVAQFVPAPEDLITKMGFAGIPVRYKEVPTGICELDPSVKSYSGYADVDKDQHIFFWFFEARNVDPLTAPLTVWMNGGPGSSSEIGLFQELGPCGVDINGNVYNNPYSWSTVSNMLFVDQPTMVGFSYSVPVPGYLDESGDVVVLNEGESCPENATDTCGTWSLPDLTLTQNSTTNAAPNFWKTIQGFMGAFPQYSRNGFHYTSESYGGHYGPVYNAYIEEQNAKDIPGAAKISLETVLIGNGWFDPMIQYAAYYNFTVFPGNTYDYTFFDESKADEIFDAMYGVGNCTDQLAQCKATGDNQICSDADNFCFEFVEYLYDEVSGRDEYDMRELTPDPFPYEFYVNYLNTPKVLAAIGAFTNFSEFNGAVGTDFGLTGDDARDSGTIEDLKTLVADGVTVALYAGDADYICNWLGVEAVAEEVAVSGWDKAGYVNMSTSDGIVHGQSKQSAKFSFTRIYEAGHEVPFYQPLAALEMFERAIKGLDIATGTVKMGPKSCFHTKGTPKSTFREGNSTVQFEVLPPNSTYNTATNSPGAPWKAKSLRRRFGH